MKTTIFNNQDHIKIHHLKDRSDEWLEFRRRFGVGGSEITSIMGLNKYEWSAQVFHNKVGTTQLRKIVNQSMFFGIMNEPMVRELHGYHDGTQEGYIENYNNGVKLRSTEEVNGVIVNDKYPFIYANIDGLIPTGQFRLDSGELLESPGILEIKTTNSFAAKQFQDGINPAYLIQLHQYLIVTETDYAELCVLTDGNKLDVYPVQRNQAVCDTIIATAKHFWEERVLPAREAFEKEQEAERKGLFEEANKYNAIVYSHEPDPDGSEACKNFLKETTELTDNEFQGQSEEYEIAQTHKTWHEVEKFAKDKKELYANTLRKFMRDNQVDKVTYEKPEYFGLNKKKAFANKIKGASMNSKDINEILNQIK